MGSRCSTASAKELPTTHSASSIDSTKPADSRSADAPNVVVVNKLVVTPQPSRITHIDSTLEWLRDVMPSDRKSSTVSSPDRLSNLVGLNIHWSAAGHNNGMPQPPRPPPPQDPAVPSLPPANPAPSPTPR